LVTTSISNTVRRRPVTRGRRRHRDRGRRGPHPRARGEGLTAKKSKIAQNEKRKATVEQYAARRAEFKEIIRSTATPGTERQAALRELRRQPRNASATRVRNRDSVDGRPRGHLRKFGLSRVRMREQAHAGFLPEVTKSSW
jgi:small subunit ribosomal protein S14